MRRARTTGAPCNVRSSGQGWSQARGGARSEKQYPTPPCRNAVQKNSFHWSQLPGNRLNGERGGVGRGRNAKSIPSGKVRVCRGAHVVRQSLRAECHRTDQPICLVLVPLVSRIVSLFLLPRRQTAASSHAHKESVSGFRLALLVQSGHPQGIGATYPSDDTSTRTWCCNLGLCLQRDLSESVRIKQAHDTGRIAMLHHSVLYMG